MTEKCRVCGKGYTDGERPYSVDVPYTEPPVVWRVHYRCIPTIAKRILNLSRPHD